jgi:uncharacterized membrane protein YeiB
MNKLGWIILSSTMVTLTTGTKPFFMLAEPVILVIALTAFIMGWVKSRKRYGPVEWIWRVLSYGKWLEIKAPKPVE